MKKKVFVCFLKSPVGTGYYIEGIRASLGILSGDEEHEVYVAFMGKGVRSALKGVDRAYSARMLGSLTEMVVGGALHVERESLAEEGFMESDLDEGFSIAPREEIWKMMSAADVTLSF